MKFPEPREDGVIYLEDAVQDELPTFTTMVYAIYDIETGKIRMKGFTSQPENLHLDILDGEGVATQDSLYPSEVTHIFDCGASCITEELPPIVQRVQAYPQSGDQFDAMLALALSLKEQGIELPEKTQKWLDDCLAVKANIPLE